MKPSTAYELVRDMICDDFFDIYHLASKLRLARFFLPFIRRIGHILFFTVQGGSNILLGRISRFLHTIYLSSTSQ